MFNQDISICRDYGEAVFARAREPLEAFPFSPDWKDRPSRFKIYQHVTRLPLPIQNLASTLSMAEILTRLTAQNSDIRLLEFEDVSALLLFVYGILKRRLTITWNTYRDITSTAIYGRGTASGGGLYPAEIYWAQGGQSSMLPGIYHYDPAHHALERLRCGNMTRRIQAATFHHPAALASEQFLILSLNFWKNAFKYADLCYHLITLDLGALLGSLRLVSLGLQADIQALLWFHDEELNHLLGLDIYEESVFAVIPLQFKMPVANPLGGVNSQSREYQHAGEMVSALQKPLTTHRSFQKSKVVRRFSRIEEIHRATLVTKKFVPLPGRCLDMDTVTDGTEDEFVDLPSLDIHCLHNNIGEVMQQRHSSFGSFSSYRPLSRCELGIVLFFAAASRGYQTDIKAALGTSSFTRLMVFINNVEHIEPGIYTYDWRRHGLWMLRKGDFRLFLQQCYLVQNHNLAETAVVIGIVGDLAWMLEAYGNRGYRMLNIEAGLVAQSASIAASTLALGCCTVLGFDNLAMNEVLGLTETNLRSLLFLLVGPERLQTASFNARFFS